MKSDLAEVEIYFPRLSGLVVTKKRLIDAILVDMTKNGSMKYSGFADKKLLRESIEGHLGLGDINGYCSISMAKNQKVRKIIKDALEKCNNILKIPTKNYIFVFPYFPSQSEEIFGGSMGFTPYSCVFQVYLDPKTWSENYLAETVAHELNHTIFYYYHYDNYLAGFTLLDNLIMEGLAENFKERVLGGKPTPWAIALSKDKAFEMLRSLNDKVLFLKDNNSIDGVLFGNDKYPHWAGYSMGYWLVKEFLHNNKNLTWEEIMKLDSRDILRSIEKE